MLTFRRMGASDEIGRGKSTFMVELSETSDILRTLTPRTLVILDECVEHYHQAERDLLTIDSVEEQAPTMV